MKLKLEIDREDDGRFIADIPKLPGVMTYGATAREAIRRTVALALRVIAERIEHGEDVPAPEVEALFSLPTIPPEL